MDKKDIILSPDYWIILSAPAGSGKTYFLSKRFLEIVKREGINPLKILAITFTEKAAGEMKMRIIQMAKRDYPEIYKKYEEEFMMLRISTIHSFCNTFLKRFANEIGIPFGFEILDESSAEIYFDEKIDEFIIEKIFKGKEKYERILKVFAFYKWERALGFLKTLLRKRPLIDNIFYKKEEEDIKKFIPYDSGDFSKYETKDIEEIFKISKKLEREVKKSNLELYSFIYYFFTFHISNFFKEILDYYFRIKSYEAKVDFADMEFYAYRILNEGIIEEIYNVLEAFDEKTNHILIDEFQDTNFLQWRIIEKLIEEWKSGMGAKFEKGEKASLFIVGDPMQSIYMFRNANVKTFEGAKRSILTWLGERAKEEVLEENYRSLKSIIDFVNKIFSNEKNYRPFLKKRNNEEKGFVEIIINEENEKEKEIRAIARRIKNLIGKELVFEKGNEKKKKCEYRDIAVLLRKRTNLSIYEKIFREEKIPYTIIGGIGFWKEPEIELLSNFVEFLFEPDYNLGLYLILKSPLFSLKDNEILFKGIDKKLKKEFEELKKEIYEKGLTFSLIDYLIKKEFFKYIANDIQKVKNVFKFFKIIFEIEKRGGNLSEILSYIRKRREIESEGKANIFSEEMNAVRILTIHKSKGLEFPIVIIPECDEIKVETREPFAFLEDEKGYKFKIYSKDKKEFEFYKEFLKELEEENKRILYVALTRARDGLIISGKFNFKNKISPYKNAFQYLLYNAKIKKSGDNYETSEKFENLKILKVEDIGEVEIKKEEKIKRERIDFERKIYLPEKETYISLDVYYSIIFGEIMHRILDAFSKGILKEENLEIFVKNLLFEKGLKKEIREKFLKEIYYHFEKLKENKIFENIVLPKENSFSEFEFVYEENGEIKKGRIDRLIIKENYAEIYDYKTEGREIFEEEIKRLKIYKEAVKNYFGIENIKTFIIFTKEGKMKEVL
jgi:ATP-dependent helicase/nuclease subunit A